MSGFTKWTPASTNFIREQVVVRNITRDDVSSALAAASLRSRYPEQLQNYSDAQIRNNVTKVLNTYGLNISSAGANSSSSSGNCKSFRTIILDLSMTNHK